MKVHLDHTGANVNLPEPWDAWVASAPVQVATAVQELIDRFELKPVYDGRLELPGAAVAALTEVIAVSLGLPRNTPLTMDVRASGAIGTAGCQLQVRWLQPGKTLPARGVAVTGPWVDWQGERSRMSAPMFETLASVERFNSLPSGNDVVDGQLKAWADIRGALGEDASQRLTDSYLRGFRVVVPTAFTLAITEDAHGQVQLEPVLLRELESLAADALSPIRALTEVEEASFVKRLDQMRQGASAFALEGGTYIVVEEPLRVCLEKVRELRKASPDERKRAARTPEAHIRELLNAQEGAALPFVETESYAERVRDISVWSAPVLPWIKISPQDWSAPAELGLRIGGTDVPLDEAVLDKLLTATREAIEKGEPKAQVGEIEIAASPANCRALESLKRSISQHKKEPTSSGIAKASPDVLIIETNFAGADFDRTKGGMRGGVFGWPMGVKTPPKPHQQLGVRWLQAHWTSGSKGALLCDDMGLGKSYQALVFALWVREQMDEGRADRRPDPLRGACRSTGELGS